MNKVVLVVLEGPVKGYIRLSRAPGAIFGRLFGSGKYKRSTNPMGDDGEDDNDSDGEAYDDDDNDDDDDDDDGDDDDDDGITMTITMTTMTRMKIMKTTATWSIPMRILEKIRGRAKRGRRI